MILFKSPQIEDIAELTAFYRKLRAHRDMQLVPEYFSSFTDTMFSRIWDEHFANPERDIAHILYRGSEKIGFVRVGEIDEEETEVLLSMPPLPAFTGELQQIYLSPECQGQGLGALLYRQAVADCKALGYKHMLMCTYTENREAQKFYLHMGAEDWGSSVLDIEFGGKKFKRPVSFWLHSDI